MPNMLYAGSLQSIHYKSEMELFSENKTIRGNYVSRARFGGTFEKEIQSQIWYKVDITTKNAEGKFDIGWFGKYAESSKLFGGRGG
jgi:hypothetical protein